MDIPDKHLVYVLGHPEAWKLLVALERGPQDRYEQVRKTLGIHSQAFQRLLYWMRGFGLVRVRAEPAGAPLGGRWPSTSRSLPRARPCWGSYGTSRRGSRTAVRRSACEPPISSRWPECPSSSWVRPRGDLGTARRCPRGSSRSFRRGDRWRGPRSPALAMSGSGSWRASGSAGISATALELHPDRAGESSADKLLRSVKESGIDRYAIYWPYGAVRPALDVEIGWLLHGIQRKDVAGDRVGIFYESNPEGRRAARERPTKDGRMVFESLERGRRTTYYQSLVAAGAVPIPWAAYEDLLEFIEVFAM